MATATGPVPVIAGTQNIPLRAVAVVVAYSPSLGTRELSLSRAALVGIFNGTVTRWNDSLIQSTNLFLKLPGEPIRLILPDLAKNTDSKVRTLTPTPTPIHTPTLTITLTLASAMT